MRIGIDIQASKGRLTGLGVYTKNLVQALKEEGRNGFEFSLFSREQDGEWNTIQRLYWENVVVPRKIKRAAVRLLHTPAFAPPLAKPCKTVVTVHDLIGMLFPNQLGWPSRFYWKKWLPLTITNADILIANSENTKKDLMTCLQIPASRIRVIYPSGHEGFSVLKDPAAHKLIRNRLGIREKYFLTVGTLEPRKNFARTLQAFSNFLKAKRGGVHYQLVIVGATDFAHGRFLATLLREQNWGNENHVTLAGYLKRQDLNLLYSGAEAFLFPSLYEGFGIPVLEAMASGTPVLTSNVSSLPEVAGDAALLVDPYDVEAITQGMIRLSSSERLRADCIAKGFETIKKFSWREAAQEILDVYALLG